MERVFDVLNRLSAAGSATSYDEEAMIFGVDVLWGYLWHDSSYRTQDSWFKAILGYYLRVSHEMLDLFNKTFCGGLVKKDS